VELNSEISCGDLFWGGEKMGRCGDCAMYKIERRIKTFEYLAISSIGQFLVRLPSLISEGGGEQKMDRCNDCTIYKIEPSIMTFEYRAISGGGGYKQIG